MLDWDTVDVISDDLMWDWTRLVEKLWKFPLSMYYLYYRQINDFIKNVPWYDLNSVLGLSEGLHARLLSLQALAQCRTNAKVKSGCSGPCPLEFHDPCSTPSPSELFQCFSTITEKDFFSSCMITISLTAHSDHYRLSLHIFQKRRIECAFQ